MSTTPAAAAVPAAATSLSAQLRERTAAAHSKAETATFMDDLIGGHASASAWTELAIQLYPIYQALEAATERYADHPLVAPIYDPALHRTAELARDLTFLLGPDTTARINAGEFTLLPATQAYTEALTDSPSAETVVANHYVRYLGDLSGGQIIATMLRRHYDLANEALNFYHFPAIPKLKVYKDNYRTALNSLPADEVTQSRIINEAITAFGHNHDLFLDLTQSHTTSLAG